MSLIPHLPPRAFYLAEERERVIFQFQRGLGQGLSGEQKIISSWLYPGKRLVRVQTSVQSVSQLSLRWQDMLQETRQGRRDKRRAEKTENDVY